MQGVDVPMPYAHAWRDCYNQIVFPIVSAKFKVRSPPDGKKKKKIKEKINDKPFAVLLFHIYRL